MPQCKKFFLLSLSLILLNGSFLKGEINPNLSAADFLSELPTHTLKALDGKKVQIRGFCYITEAGENILAFQPRLQSCCLKTSAKIHQQLVIKNSFNLLPTDRVVLLEGVFKIQPLYHAQKELTQLYVLENVKVIPHPIPYLLILILSGLVIFLVTGVLWVKKKIK